MILAVHERIVREALGDALGPRSLRLVMRANRRSDLHQLAPEYHFDSAPDARTLCDLWQRGLHTWLMRTTILSGLSMAAGSPSARLAGYHDALANFGRATHALADFYSHTNWIELATSKGETPVPAPLLGDTCDPQALPSGLQSGYFSLRHGLNGCPRGGPPPGFAYCHSGLNKDAPNRGHGAERPTPGGPTYHEIAVQLAVASTRAAWEPLAEAIRETGGDARFTE
jgi:hypothetical protein